MIDIAFAARDRIARMCPVQFRWVGMLADVARIADMAKATPAALVVPVGERAGRSVAMSSDVQVHEVAFAVLYIVRSAGDASGERAADALSELRDAVAAALVSWVPECGAAGTIEPVQFASGALADMDDGFTAWQDDFSTSRLVRRAH